MIPFWALTCLAEEKMSWKKEKKLKLPLNLLDHTIETKVFCTTNSFEFGCSTVSKSSFSSYKKMVCELSESNKLRLMFPILESHVLSIDSYTGPDMEEKCEKKTETNAKTRARFVFHS